MRILVVEDNLKIASTLVKYLRENDWQVYKARTVKRAVGLLQTYVFDIVSLDIILPDGKGTDLIDVVRKSSTNRNARILVLTNETEIRQRLEYFGRGGDDFLGKPFFKQEYLARVNTLYRSMRVAAGERVKVSDSIQMIEMKQQLLVGNCLIQFTAKEFRIVFLLCTNEVVSVEMLLAQGYTNAEAVRTAISRINRKVREGANRRLVYSRRGEGYYIKR